MQLAAKIREARTALSHRHTERLGRKRLSDELAAFASSSARAELDDVLSRYPSDQTREIREILSHQDAKRVGAAMAGSARR